MAMILTGASGRGLIPKTPLGGPPCGFVSCKGGGLLLSLFQFLFSIFRPCRAELASGEIFQGVEACVHLGGGQAAQAVERAQKIQGWAAALARVAFEAARKPSCGLRQKR